MQEQGTISIHSENIFPIIKKFLYADSEIFLRELVSNAVDATQKLKHLASLGEYAGEVGDTKISVSLDTEAKTITINDKGIGMTAEEIKKYINQIAFSGATEFVEKYKDKSTVDSQQIIGHFGLGFYSAYMVAHTVEIDSLSHQEGAEPAHWTCDGSTSFSIDKGKRTERGTTITLHVSEEGEEFLDKFRLKNILDKYCKFLPVEIEYDGAVINNPKPLWTLQPSELKDEDYLNFYKELYPMSPDPLFWIHLNVDYPFNLTGVLYFPRIKNDFDIQKNKIKLFSRQVFITDEVKDVVPDFLMLLHGVIDSPDIPLNVSRSFLQTDSNVRKINAHITKKVADKLNELFKIDRKSFEEKWNDINVFVKYGMISEEKFYDKAEKICLFKDTADNYQTIEEYKTKVAEIQKDKDGKIVVPYTSDVALQDAFIQSANAKSYSVVVLDTVIDSHFIGQIEQKHSDVQFKRVDSETIEKLIDKGEEAVSVLTEDEKTKVKTIFEEVINDKNYIVAVEALPSDELPVSIVLPEFMRRMKDMSKAQAMSFMGEMPNSYNLAVNANHALTQKILKGSEEEQKALAKQSIDLALLSQGLLKGKSLTDFIKRSVALASGN